MHSYPVDLTYNQNKRHPHFEFSSMVSGVPVAPALRLLGLNIYYFVNGLLSPTETFKAGPLLIFREGLLTRSCYYALFEGAGRVDELLLKGYFIFNISSSLTLLISLYEGFTLPYYLPGYGTDTLPSKLNYLISYNYCFDFLFYSSSLVFF